MRVTLALLAFALVGVASAGIIAAPTTLLRAPKFDSAVIQSDRIGGNFAYSTAEAHAYEAINPVVENVVHPVAVSYAAHSVVLPHAAVVAAPVPAVVAGPAVLSAPVVAAHHPVLAYHHQPLVHVAAILPAAVPAVEADASASSDSAAAEPAPEPAPAEPAADAPAADAPASDDAVSVDAA